jgi:hypothetical protein
VQQVELVDERQLDDCQEAHHKIGLPGDGDGDEDEDGGRELWGWAQQRYQPAWADRWGFLQLLEQEQEAVSWADLFQDQDDG